MWTKEKFLSLSLKQQHKKCAEQLKLALVKDEKGLPHYHEMASWLGLDLESDREKLYDRYHFHLTEAHLSLKEHNFLPEVKRFDHVQPKQTLPIALYLDQLRSAYNVGAILRTAESFGIENICFSEKTPFIDNPKVEATSKGTAPLLNCHKDVEALPRPLIALETHEKAHPIESFTFPQTFTLILGNEEYGVSTEMLAKADHIIHIPLMGTKNSINVASAFAIVAHQIQTNAQLQPLNRVN